MTTRWNRAFTTYIFLLIYKIIGPLKTKNYRRLGICAGQGNWNRTLSINLLNIRSQSHHHTVCKYFSLLNLTSKKYILFFLTSKYTPSSIKLDYNYYKSHKMLLIKSINNKKNHRSQKSQRQHVNSLKQIPQNTGNSAKNWSFNKFKGRKDINNWK